MKNNKPNLIILAKCNGWEDAEFYQIFLKEGSRLRDKANIYFVPTVAQLSEFLYQVSPDFSFILFIHAGMQAPNAGSDGLDFEQELKELPYGNAINYYNTSREPSASIHNVIYTQKMTLRDFTLDGLKKNYVSAFGIHPGNDGSVIKGKYAILTALDKDENDIIRDNLDKSSIAEHDLHSLSGKFKEKSVGFKDFDRSFVLAKQPQMGMVDTAFSCSSIYHHHHPEYLLMSGVCGGRKAKVNIFDVIIPYKVFDYSFGSLENGAYVLRDQDAKINSELIDLLDKTEMKKKIKQRMLELVDTSNNDWEKYVQNSNLHFGVMACGPWVVKTEGFIEKLSKEQNDLICGLEMESFSMGRASELFQVKGMKTLIIKSVMDYTDEKKGDTFNNIPVKKIAGFIAYLCTRAIMSILEEDGAKLSWNKA